MRPAWMLGSLVVAALTASSARAQSPQSPGWSNAHSLQAVIEDGAQQQHDKRIASGFAALGVGGVFTGLGIGLTVDGFSKTSTITPENGAGVGMLIGGGVTVLAVPFIFLLPADMERFADETRPLAQAGNLKEMESRLAAHARAEHTFRLVFGLVNIGIAAVITPIGVVSAVTNGSLDQNSRFNAGAVIGVVDAILITAGVAQLIAPSLAEQIHSAWVAGSWRSATIEIRPLVSPQSTGFALAF